MTSAGWDLPPTPQPAPSRTPRWAPWLLLVIGLVGVALIAWPLVPRGGGEAVPGDTNSARPTGSVWDERSQEPAVADLCAGVPQHRLTHPETASQLYGGGLVADVPAGFQLMPGGLAPMLDDQAVAAHRGDGWASSIIVGRQPAAAGMEPREVAAALADCATSGLPDGATASRGTESAFPVAGRDGWQVSVSVDLPDGSVTHTIVVVDTGADNGPGVFWGIASGADKGAGTRIESSLKSLTTEG